MRARVIQFIEFFHFPFLQRIPFETFKYLFSGASTVVVDIVVFYLSYHFIFFKQVVDTPFITLEPYTAALALGILASFCWGFVINKYIVFTNSPLRGRIQLFRYAVIFASNILFNYALMKLLVEKFRLYPTPSKILITVLISVYSYIAQRRFTFRVK